MLRQRLTTGDQRLTTRDQKRYNNPVNAPSPSRPAVAGEHDAHTHRQHRHSIYAAEATGLLVMAAVLLILTVIRYWRYIPWDAR
jgi:hypothetical protein